MVGSKKKKREMPEVTFGIELKMCKGKGHEHRNEGREEEDGNG